MKIFYTGKITTQKQNTLEKIQEYAFLPVGWHFGEGFAPSKETVYSANFITDWLHKLGFPKTDAFPGSDGEIQISGYRNRTILEFNIQNNGQIDFYAQQNGRELSYVEDLTMEDALTCALALQGQVWASSVTLKYQTTTKPITALPVPPSIRPVMKAESLLSATTASERETQASVRILPSFTPNDQKYRTSSASYLMTLYQQTADLTKHLQPRMTPVISTS